MVATFFIAAIRSTPVCAQELTTHSVRNLEITVHARHVWRFKQNNVPESLTTTIRSADEMSTSFTVTGLYQDRPAKRDTVQACCFDLLVSLVQADYATGLPELSEGHGTLCVYAKEKLGQHLRKGKMHHLAIFQRSVQTRRRNLTSESSQSGWNLVKVAV